MTTPRSLVDVIRHGPSRTAVAADAVAEAHEAVRARSGLGGLAARVGLDTINLLRPGFLHHHVHAMLPDMARAVEPHWHRGQGAGDGAIHLEKNADIVTHDLLAVTDAYVANASDDRAIAVYNRLRVHAPKRIAEQMPRIAAFIERHTPPST